MTAITCIIAKLLIIVACYVCILLSSVTHTFTPITVGNSLAIPTPTRGTIIGYLNQGFPVFLCQFG